MEILQKNTSILRNLVSFTVMNTVPSRGGSWIHFSLSNKWLVNVFFKWYNSHTHVSLLWQLQLNGGLSKPPLVPVRCTCTSCPTFTYKLIFLRSPAWTHVLGDNGGNCTVCNIEVEHKWKPLNSLKHRSRNIKTAVQTNYWDRIYYILLHHVQYRPSTP